MDTCKKHSKNNSARITMCKKLSMVILFIAIGTTIFAQNLTVTGNIIDPDGESMIGVNIIIKGTTTGTVTDLDGNFSLNTDSKDTLLVSYIGFLNENIPVNGRTKIDITLSFDLLSLDEVIVVGYGVQKKSDVTGSIASIKVEDMERMKAPSIDQAMQGRAAGVTVTSNSGSPGSPAMVVIRGIGSINGGSPLWVIDGVPSGGGNVNPADIESMEILKDASACAIYGARGADGVILITTKKGTQGKGTISYDGNFQLNSMAKKIDMVSASNWGMLREEALLNSGFPVPPDIGDYPSLGKGTYWQDEVTRMAQTMEHTVSFSGGSEKFNYYLSVNNLNQDGIVNKTNYNRTTLRLNTSYKIKDWLTVGENISVSGEATKGINEDDEWNAVLISAIAKDPITEPNKENGVWDETYYTTIRHPVAQIEYTNNEEKYNSVGGDVYLDFNFKSLVDGLSFKTDLGFEKNYGNDQDFIPVFYIRGGEENETSNLSKGFYEILMYNWSNVATYTKDFGLHSLTVIGGSEYQSVNSEYYGLSVNGLISDDMRMVTVDNASGNEAAMVYGSYGEGYLFSLLGRVNYSFKNRYLLTANVRRDGSSRFGPDKKFGLFPSVSLGWKITEEDFMQGTTFLNSLKLRAGIGENGRDQIQEYLYVSSATSGMRYPLNHISRNGAAFQTLANPEIQWETQVTTNFAIDAAMFENQFTVVIDLYNKKSTDMLVAAPMAAHIGAEVDQTRNVGSMKNTGIELELGFKKQISDFKIDIIGTLAYNKNELTSLGGEGMSIQSAEFQGLGYISRTEVGHPIASFYGFVTDGLFQNETEIANHVGPDGELLQENAEPGDIRFKDADGDGVLDEEFIGSPFPDFTFGLNTYMQYRGLDFTLFLQGVQGNEVFNAAKYYTHNSSTEYGLSVDMMDRWIMEGSTNDVNTPRLRYNDSNNNYRKSDRYIEDGSYLRIKTIQLGYTLPNSLFNNKIQKLRVYVSANNLVTFTKYSGFDPEVGVGYDGVLDIGIDRAKYPTARTYIFGVSLMF